MLTTTKITGIIASTVRTTANSRVAMGLKEAAEMEAMECLCRIPISNSSRFNTTIDRTAEEAGVIVAVMVSINS